jgi:hypothetical protein
MTSRHHDRAEPTDPLPQADPLVVRFLETVGVSRQVAPTLARAGELLHRLAALAPAGTEFAAALDAVSGASVGPHVRGTHHVVDIWPLLAQMHPGRTYVVVHTHPAGSSFSLDDALYFVATPPMQMLAAIAGDGTWFAFSTRLDGPRADPTAVRAAYATAVRRLVPAFTARLLRGELTAQDALQELEHQVWCDIAPALGVGYDRSR